MLRRSSVARQAVTGPRLRGLNLGLLALLGAAGSALVALGSDLPGSPYGPHAAGLWPLAGSGPTPGWEGGELPRWANIADQSSGVSAGHLLVVILVVLGVVLLGAAWGLLSL